MHLEEKLQIKLELDEGKNQSRCVMELLWKELFA